MKRIVGNAGLAAPAGALIAWLWNGFIGTPEMTAEVAATIGGLIGPVIAYLVSWLPAPETSFKDMGSDGDA